MKINDNYIKNGPDDALTDKEKINIITYIESQINSTKCMPIFMEAEV